MRWHTVGGRLRSTKHSRRLVKNRWRQTRTTFSIALAWVRPSWMPDAVPTVIATAPGAGRRANEMAAATAMVVKYRGIIPLRQVRRNDRLAIEAAKARYPRVLLV